MRSTIRPIFTVSCATAGAVSAKNTTAKNVLIRLAPGIGALGGGDALVVAVGDAPLIGASRGPLPVLGAADLVVVVELLDLRGVLDDAAVRADEIAEDIVAGTVTSRSPDRREAGVAHAADAAHYRIDALHFESDVIERRDPGARVGDAMVRAVAAHEIHVARAVADLEAELLDGEALGGIGVGGIQHHVRELDRPVALRRQRRHRRLDDEAVSLAIRSFDLALFADLGTRAAEGDAADRGFALLETDDVGQARGAAQLGTTNRRKAPDLLEEFRRLGYVGDSQFNALQLHSTSEFGARVAIILDPFEIITDVVRNWFIARGFAPRCRA